MWGELCPWGFGLALLSSKCSPRSACWENSIPAGVLPSPLLLSAHLSCWKEMFRGSWHGKLNSCLNQQEAAREDGCPAFGSNIALVIDRANSACPLPCYDLITCTLPRTGLSLPARDVFILGCPGSQSGWGCSCASCTTRYPEPPSSGGCCEPHKLGLCGVGSHMGG